MVDDLGYAYADAGNTKEIFCPTGDPIGLRWNADTGEFTGPVDEFSTLERRGSGLEWTSKRGTRRRFDAEGLQTAKLDRHGNTTRYQYAGERLTAIVDPVGETTRLTYRSQRLHTVTDPAGRATTFQHDATGNLTQVTFPDGSTRRYGVSGQTRPLLTVVGRGNSSDRWSYRVRRSMSERNGR